MENVSFNSGMNFNNVIATELLKKLKVNNDTFDKIKWAGNKNIAKENAQINSNVVAPMPELNPVVTPATEQNVVEQTPTTKTPDTTVNLAPIGAPVEKPAGNNDEASNPEVKQDLSETNKVEENGIYKVVEGEIDAVKILGSANARERYNNVKLPDQMYKNAFVNKEEVKAEAVEKEQTQAPVAPANDINENIQIENEKIEASEPLVEKKEETAPVNSEVALMLAKIAEEAKKAEEQNLARIKAKEEENAAKVKFEEQEVKLNERQEELEEEQRRFMQAKEDNEEQKRIGAELRDNVSSATETLKEYTRKAINETNEALNNTQRYNNETADMKTKETQLVEEIGNTNIEREKVSMDTENKMKENELLGSALQSVTSYLQPVDIDRELEKNWQLEVESA